mmetsp:Transcript_10454/g.43280  ORF Transcript_10454/g.43280 Transcript_10454/m.43280 type:complete len:249 (-) Transcript_10454:390-1136(-)
MPAHASSSAAVHPSVESTTTMTASAPVAAATLLRTPIASTSSTPAPRRIPAVSSKVTGSPAHSTRASTTSLVVPAIGVTMALSLLDHAFSSELLPALGLPTMATVTPVSSNSPLLAVASTPATSARTARTSAATAARSSGVVSSSKSSRASSSASRSTHRARASRTGDARPPRNAASAPSAARSVLAVTSECTASACVRSSLPLRKARRVNSPGLASRTPAAPPDGSSRSRPVSSESTRWTQTLPPWQ